MKKGFTFSNNDLFLLNKISIFLRIIYWISGYKESKVVNEAEIFFKIFF